MIATGARRVTDSMLVAAARALSQLAPARSDAAAALYPPITQVRVAARRVALAVGAEAQRAGVAEPTSAEALARSIDVTIWAPHYGQIRRVAHDA